MNEYLDSILITNSIEMVGSRVKTHERHITVTCKSFKYLSLSLSLSLSLLFNLEGDEKNGVILGAC